MHVSVIPNAVKLRTPTFTANKVLFAAAPYETCFGIYLHLAEPQNTLRTGSQH